MMKQHCYRSLGTAILAAIFWGSAEASYFDGFFALETGDYAVAHEEWRAEAVKGDAKSMGGLGTLYEEGLGVPKDPVLAYVYYELASRLGDTKAAQGRTRVMGKLSLEDLETANNLRKESQQTGQLPPRVRKSTTQVQTPSQSQAQTKTKTTTQIQPDPTPEPQPQPAAPAEQPAITPSGDTTRAVAGPLIELRFSCRYELGWKDEGSGGVGDVTLFQPILPTGVSVIGGYAQGNYHDPYGCVTTIRSKHPRLLKAPRKWKQVWTDKGSGARMDGSIWAAVPPSNDYVCLGMIAREGYRAPSLRGYACVHRCMVSEVPASQPV